MEELVFEFLKERNFIKGEDVIAYNEVNIDGTDVVIKGNKLGLIQLADYLVQIAISDTDNHHIHLDGDNFFDNANCEIIIAKQLL
ncbi:MAG: hypothetical protein FWG87_13570 [Defluviitaleaceae bacterium]|nr:hypothetical protein [Defluviitaleaceae bacterium]